MSKRYWVYDYETICNCFIAVFEDYGSAEREVFVCHDTRNDIPQMISFLEECKTNRDWHFGYNNIAFDAQITESILKNKGYLLSLKSGSEVAGVLYKVAQQTIERSNAGEFPEVGERYMQIPQIDIFKINHWDSNAKRTSLKWVQFSMDWDNVQEMPHPHYEPVRTEQELNMVLEYCINDVRSTKSIYHFKDDDGKEVMKDQIRLRKKLSDDYGLMLHNASEPRISKEMFLHFLSEKLGMDKRDVRNMRTRRSHVILNNIILPYVRFDTPEMRAVLNWFRSLSVEIKEEENPEEREKKGPKYTMMYKGVKTDYGLGGLHGCTKPGIYEAKDGKIILSADVTSFYPNLAIRNGWSPAHLPQKNFCDLYEWFFEERKKYDKKHPLNYVFKIILNSTYGLSKNIHSFLYDPEFTFRITINGQLLLTMLYEMVATRIPGAVPLMQNTDGLEFLVDAEHEELFYQICREWEAMTSLELETVQYKKMIISDVNNYIAIYDNGKTKCKGRYEFTNLALHKNKSYQVIPKAWFEYFVNGVDPKDYLDSNEHIHDYCAGAKIRGKDFFVKRWVEDACYREERLQKLVRYYISPKGAKLIKCNDEGREMQLEAGRWMQTVFNEYEEKPFEEYNVEKSFYLEKIYQEIQKVERDSPVLNNEVQLSLF